MWENSTVLIKEFRQQNTWGKFNPHFSKNDLAIKSSLSNGWIVQFSLSSYSHFLTVIISLNPSVKHPQTKNILQYRSIKNDHKSTLYLAEYGFCLNSEYPKNLMQLTAKIESSAQVINRALLVSIHKQQVCIIVRVWNCVWYCIVCVSNYV